MVYSIKAALQKCQQLESDHHAVKVIALIPFINNIFFQIKSEQFDCKTNKEMENIGWYMWLGLHIQIFIYAKPFAARMQHLDFKGHYNILVNSAAYYLLSKKHINCLSGQRN